MSRGWPGPAASLAYIAMEALLGIGAWVAVRVGATTAAIAVDVGAAVLLTVAAGLVGALSPDQGARA